MGQDGTTPPEEERPPLPPRPTTTSSIDPKLLQAHATTAVTPVEIETLSFPDGSRGTFTKSPVRSASTPRSDLSSGYSSPSRRPSGAADDRDETASITSFTPTMRPAGDIASLLVGELSKKSPAFSLLQSQAAAIPPFEKLRLKEDDLLYGFDQEFGDLPQEGSGEYEDDRRLLMWKAKLKHYMILSSAGKPIWSRHGDLSLINSSIGVIQTIISFYQGSENPLQAFTAGHTRFVVSTQGPLYFIAISKLGESDTQLRAQLEALYMQILSTLTLPTLTNIFVNRPSSDLRKPLQGTESLLSSLADSFTRGSPSALLSSLECLKLRKSHRSAITSTFLKLRSEKLLYGLIVAGGRLVSVIRPRRHSLHPTDLQLIFNMLFESEGVKAGGGENWIPLCLPAFNNKGYLYMYVSYLDETMDTSTQTTEATESGATDEQIAIILVSVDRESFYEMKQMKDQMAQKLAKQGSLSIIQQSVKAGRPKISDIAPGSQISHFLYKSRANVQFCMGSLEPTFTDAEDRRRLMSVYHELQASVHNKHSHLKVLHCVSEEATSLAWITPSFEFYCVAGPNLSRQALTQGANKIIQWTKKEEERLFILGGGVF